MESTTIIAVLVGVAVIPFILLLIGYWAFKKIKREQEVQSMIPLPNSAESGEDSRRISEKLRKEKLRRELS